jgi:hypothetical protein
LIDVFAFQGLEKGVKTLLVSDDANAPKDFFDFLLCRLCMVKADEHVCRKILHLDLLDA